MSIKLNISFLQVLFLLGAPRLNHLKRSWTMENVNVVSVKEQNEFRNKLHPPLASVSASLFGEILQCICHSVAASDFEPKPDCLLFLCNVKTLELPVGSLKMVHEYKVFCVSTVSKATIFPSLEENILEVKQLWCSGSQQKSPSPEETSEQADLFWEETRHKARRLMSHFEADLRMPLWLQGLENCQPHGLKPETQREHVSPSLPR